MAINRGTEVLQELFKIYSNGFGRYQLITSFNSIDEVVTAKAAEGSSCFLLLRQFCSDALSG